MTSRAAPFGVYRAGIVPRTAWRLADERRLPDALRRRLRRWAQARFQGPFDVIADGLRFRVRPSGNYDGRKIMARRRLPERCEHALLAGLLHEGDVFVDVGANIGAYTIFAARCVGSVGLVIAIEPQREVREQLAFHVAANDAANVAIVAAGAGDEAASKTLYCDTTNRGFSTLVGAFAGAHWIREEIATMPLATLLDEVGVCRVDAIKLDIEGFEDRALLPFIEGCSDAQLPRVVMIETNCRSAWRTDCIAALAARGYAMHAKTQDNMILLRNH